MGLSITSRSGNTYPNAPVTGNIATNDGLVLAVRPTNPLNLLDVSPVDTDVEVIRSYPMLGPFGIKGNRDNLVDTGCDPLLYDDFTFISVSALEVSPGNTAQPNNWPYSNYRLHTDAGVDGFASVGGDGLRYTTETGGDTPSGQVARMYSTNFFGMRKSDQLLAPYGAKVAARTPYDPSAAPTDWAFEFIVQRLIKNDDGSWKVEVWVPSIGNDHRGSSTTSTYTFDGPTRASTWPDTDARTLKLLGTNMSNGGSTDETNHRIKLKEILCYGRALSDAEVMRQYEATKRWLRAEAGVDTSYWS